MSRGKAVLGREPIVDVQHAQSRGRAHEPKGLGVRRGRADDESAAVERDERAIPALEEIAQRYPGRLTIVNADATTFDPRPHLNGERAKIVANLPYNIATSLLVDWLSAEPWPPWYDMMVLMFQREVAERIVARENDEAYGRLGVLANWRAETKILFDISPGAFV